MSPLHVTVDQAQAVVVLWEQGRHDTVDIARAVHISEAAVCRIIHAVREASLASAELWSQVEGIAGQGASL